MDSVAKLKFGKSDCPRQILSYTNINGTHKLCVYISLLFSCMFVQGSPFQAFIIYNCTDSKGYARESYVVIQQITELYRFVKPNL